MSAPPHIRSAVCEGHVSHARRVGPLHGFRYRLFMLLIDLDELPELDRRLRLFGHNRWRLVDFRERDHLDGRDGELRTALERRLLAEGHALPDGRIELLTHARLLGYVFNPVSFYYCYHRDGALALVVAEVNNTFGDRHLYVLPVGDEGFTWHRKKVMHVSPFMQPDAGTYRWTLPPPADRIEVGIDLTVAGETALAARLSLDRRPLDDASLLRALLRHPLMTLVVIGAIHLEAWRLWRKRAPFWPQPAYDPQLFRGGPS